MDSQHYFFGCSRQYLDSISLSLFNEIQDVVSHLPKRLTQAELNRDLFWLLASKRWSYDTAPAECPDFPPADLEVEGLSLGELKKHNNRTLCVTSTTIESGWHSDFAKVFDGKLVQIEAQFGKVESMFKDFCGFKIAWYEKRIALGIEIVICEPGRYFSHRKSSVSGMAYFEIAKKTLPAIGLDCPIWLLGITV